MKLINKIFILPTLACLPTLSLFSCGTNENVELEPEACFLKETILEWTGEGTEATQLHPIIYPQGCHPKLIWESSDPVNLCVTDTGFVYIRGSLPPPVPSFYDETVSVYPQGHKELVAKVHIVRSQCDDDPDDIIRTQFVFNADWTFDDVHWAMIASFCKDIKGGRITQEQVFREMLLKRDDGTLYIPQSFSDYLGIRRKIKINGIEQEVEVIAVNQDYQFDGSAPIFTFQFTHPICDNEGKPIKVKWDSEDCKNYWSSDIRYYLNNNLFSNFEYLVKSHITPVTRKATTYQDGHWGVTCNNDLPNEEDRTEKLFLPSLNDIYDYDDLNIFYKDENMRYNPDFGYKDRQYWLYKKNVKDSKREKTVKSLIKTDLEGNPVSYWLASPSAFEFQTENNLVNVITQQGINDYSTYTSDQELCILPCFCI